MTLPIPVGTVLRQRYIIQQILGQGGFGRTYLALDQERFNEYCVLKEFVVPYQDPTQIEKAKTLFQREASILYQIQHPQIPRFWAAFEEDQRLFLVQDYIQGPTYRQLLNDRKQYGMAFSEAEVLYFLNHLLPVLAAIHNQDIIHRDITPENIILRPNPTNSADSTHSSLPVLIDFGAVKEATTYWPLTSGLTRVGKVGYAPPEQLQTGKVYPNSDLYALAATSLVLLTGREPQTLLDSRTLTWQWQSYTNISEPLAAILRKMLAFYSSDRYPSANDVLIDLQPLLNSIAHTELQTANSLAQETPGSTRPGNWSMVVEHPTLPPLTSEPVSGQSNSVVSLPSGSKRRGGDGKKSIVPISIAASVLVGLGIATPLVWRTWKQTPDSRSEVWVSGARMSQAEALRILNSQGLDSSSAALRTPNAISASPSSNYSSSAIQFKPGELSKVLQGNLENQGTRTYILKAFQGQIITATLKGEGVLMNLLRSNQDGIDAAAYRTRSWTGQLPADDQYLIQLSGSGSYQLEVTVSPLSRPNLEQTQRVTFARGTTGTTVTGRIGQNELRRYLLEAKQGQLLVVKVLEGQVQLSTIAPDGQRIGGSATHSNTWQGRAPLEGDYVIEVSTQKAGKYALAVEIF